MAQHPVVRHVMLGIACLGAMLVAAGGIMGIYQNRKVATLETQQILYFYTLALLVPIFSLTGHLRRAPQLLTVATVMAFFSASNLVTYCIGLKHKIDMLPHAYAKDYEMEFIGSILCIVGMFLSSFPLFVKSAPRCLHMIMGCIISALWFTAGMMFALVTAESGVYDLHYQNLCFIFVVWTFVAALTRQTTLTIGLTATQFYFLIFYFVSLVGKHDHTLRLVAGYLSILAIVTQVAWVIFDYTQHGYSDSTSNKADKASREGYSSLLE